MSEMKDTNNFTVSSAMKKESMSQMQIAEILDRNPIIDGTQRFGLTGEMILNSAYANQTSQNAINAVHEFVKKVTYGIEIDTDINNPGVSEFILEFLRASQALLTKYYSDDVAIIYPGVLTCVAGGEDGSERYRDYKYRKFVRDMYPNDVIDIYTMETRMADAPVDEVETAEEEQGPEVEDPMLKMLEAAGMEIENIEEGEPAAPADETVDLPRMEGEYFEVKEEVAEEAKAEEEAGPTDEEISDILDPIPAEEDTVTAETEFDQKVLNVLHDLEAEGKITSEPEIDTEEVE